MNHDDAVTHWTQTLALCNSNRETRRAAGMYEPKRSALATCLAELHKAKDEARKSKAVAL